MASPRIALDDFGTGFATLQQLQMFHVDKIKIDRSFVDRICEDNDSMMIVRAILGLASGFGLTTTAEGTENIEQLAWLKANGCSEGQGYLFGKAVPAQSILPLLKLGLPDIPQMADQTSSSVRRSRPFLEPAQNPALT